jgi:hypothetical protein
LNGGSIYLFISLFEWISFFSRGKVQIFLYLICHDFRKIIGRIKIFKKCTSDAAAHGVRLLPPHHTTLRPCRRGERQHESNSRASAASTAPGTCRRAAWRQALNAMPHGDWII